MKQNPILSRVSFDLYSAQMKWSIWYISILLLVHITMVIIAVNLTGTFGDFLAFSYGTSKVYMLVIGILSAYAFLTFYVNHGITRIDYFKGTVISALAISISLTFIAAVLNVIEYVIFQVINIEHVLDSTMGNSHIQNADQSISIDLTGMMVSGSSFIDSNNWLVSLIVYSMTIFIAYLIGWLIGVGYYRFGWIIGFGFIALAIIMSTLLDLLWGQENGLVKSLSNWLAFDLNVPLVVSILGTLVLIGLTLWFIRLLTRDVPIKK